MGAVVLRGLGRRASGRRDLPHRSDQRVSARFPRHPALPTVHGAWHDGLSLMGFVSLVVACFVFARRFARAGAPGWAWGSVLCGVGFAVLMGLANVGFAQDGRLENIAGLFQRLAVTLGLAWQALLGLYLLRHRPEPRSARVVPEGRGSARTE
ncbi:DUF998 domain-containing protein [Actinomadura namibiensis]|uniref:DUF998 domain-containing protein n=1 Tax=Actinomadura kijaniata TaxID=46161 RepID=UPI0035E461CC